MKRDGFTLVEILTVIAIIGIVAGMAVISFSGMVRRYNVESQIKELYSDLVNTRVMAMSTKKTHFVDIKSGQYSAYVDTNTTNPNQDGDGILQDATDVRLAGYPKTFKFPLSWGGGSTTIEFSAKGLANTSNTFCVFSNINPAYDCIVVSWTRIILGKLKSQGSCSGNCETKQ
ncbi:MAG TPA: hypothetical protein DDW17_01115 [Deltaproteobacteria bacterium]|nr:hypothetical protein [Deltaproteobacteria bacterium]